METITYYKRKEGSRVFKHVGFDEKYGDFLFNTLFSDDKPFKVRKEDIQKDFIHVPDFDIEKVERQTCGRRGETHFGNTDIKDPDYWEISPNGDKTCSFCGSAHWDIMNKIVDKTISGEDGYDVEPSTKSYKIYIRQPEVRNASEGAIKFYTHHVPSVEKGEISQELMDDANKRYGQAVKISNDRFQKRFNRG